MKIVLQRVLEAEVNVDGEMVGSIGCGYVLFLGVGQGDTEASALQLANKVQSLRIFPDAAGKTNLSSADINGEVLVISQFTLYADCKKGNRPGFTEAAEPALAKALYEYFVILCKTRFSNTAQGVFGADMKVSLINDGPFTLTLEA